MNWMQIEMYADYWLLALKQMQEHGVITSHQKAGLVRKVKAWVYDRGEELEEGELV